MPIDRREELEGLIARAQATIASRRDAEPANPTAGPESASGDRPRALTWTEWVEWIQWVQWVER